MIYKKLFNLIETNFLIKWLSFFYIHLTEYKPIFVKLNKNSNLTIVHHHELRHRKDFDFFLLELHKSINDSSLIIFKRSFKLPMSFFENKYKKFEQDVKSSFTNYLKFYKRLVIFFPHMPAGAILQNLAKLNNQRVELLQHGFYRHSLIQDQIFSESTQGDRAYIFSKQYKDFFRNCKKIYTCGSYLIKDKKSATLDLTSTYVFLSLIQKHNINEAILFVNHMKESNVRIKHHPRTNFLIKLIFWFKFKQKKIHLNFRNSLKVGIKNYFINTSAWQDIDFPDKAQIYLVNLEISGVEKYTPVMLEKLRTKSFKYLVRCLSS